METLRRIAIALAAVIAAVGGMSSPGSAAAVSGPFVLGTGSFTLVPNGGFESGVGIDPSDWSPLNFFKGVQERTTEKPFTGIFSLALPAGFTNEGFGIAQITDSLLPVTPGVPYVLSAFIFNGITGGGQAYLDLNDVTVDAVLGDPSALSTSGSGDWQFVFQEFTPRPGVTAVRVRTVVDASVAVGSKAFFDQVALTPLSEFAPPQVVSEPRILLLLGTGLAGLARVARMRRGAGR